MKSKLQNTLVGLILIGIIVLVLFIFYMLVATTVELSLGKYHVENIIARYGYFETNTINKEKTKVGTPKELLKINQDKSQSAKLSGKKALSFGYLEGSSKETTKFIYYEKGKDGYSRKSAKYDNLLFQESSNEKATISSLKRVKTTMRYLTPVQKQRILRAYDRENGFKRFFVSPLINRHTIETDLNQVTHTEKAANALVDSYNRRVLAGKLEIGSYDGSGAEISEKSYTVVRLPKNIFTKENAF